MEKVYERYGVNPVFVAEKHPIFGALLKGFLIRSGWGQNIHCGGGIIFF
jgi:hypothetical protein